MIERKEVSVLQEQTIINVCLLAGRIMLKSGAETYRVEDTMVRIANAYGLEYAQSHVTPTAIMFASSTTNPTNFVRIVERVTDLHKVSQVNSVSRRISTGDLTLDEACDELEEIEMQKNTYPVWVQLLAAAAASGGFTIMFQGAWSDFFPALVVGSMAYGAMQYFHRTLKVRFFAEFLASIILGFLAYLFSQFGIGADIDKIIIGSVMPLVPGLLITNAVRDLMAHHLVSGIAKTAEAALTALAIGAGVAAIFFIV
ncbi:Uncharacterized membrane protein YjjP, DUF1212 family [Pelagirhabdus alkalitolerans]|uniref:Uncharacterized membrane protein YjjP, DUF1212 family n=1 Tax=Pelagirhabdus alkalitolerans TaxID=1612202 RepID=A0A1G6GKL9_9BACI|nr:threonine/serine exporter family protein [Pelagirhabdus alkalitolerans]SDB82474.1 Uncharacterized membrane protein YjjP, DUF1212 family [Pelagirhabdus alkalitolerans]